MTEWWRVVLAAIQLVATALAGYCLWSGQRFRRHYKEQDERATQEYEKALALLYHAKAHLDTVDRLPEVQCEPKDLH